VTRTHSQGTTVHTAADEQTNYIIVVRTEESAPERHARWDDIVIGRTGSGTVRIGRSQAGMRELAPGEYRGGTLGAPAELHIGPGDVARIPAGVPHAFVPDRGAPFEFLLIKVRRPTKPLK
jgi:mannose-6-phosphate isomerase-like protein (cupin superfamily)